MKTMFGTKKSLGFASALLVVVMSAISLWQYNAEAMRIDSSGDYLSIGMALATESGSSEGSSDTYTTSVVAEKSPNYYEIDYPGSGSKIEIGELSRASDFKPDLTISTWDREAEFKLIAPTNLEEKSPLTTSLSDDTISASNGEWEFQYKPTEPKEGFNDKGGIDILITAKVKPASNRIEFTYISETVTPYFQPPLTEEYEDGRSGEFQTNITVSETQVISANDSSILLERPEHVVNSIAFYSNDKSGDRTALGGKNYRAGKVGHLYRMKAMDAAGKSEWVNWSLQATTITATLSQSFIDSAAYPITIQPVGDTFGYTTAGSSYGALSTNTIAASGAGAPAGGDGTTDNISVYSKLNTSAQDVYVGLYDDSTGPNAKVSGSPVTNAAVGTYSATWKVFTMGGISVTNGTTYWNTIQTDGSNLSIYYDSVGGTNRYWDTGQAEGTWQSTFGRDSSSGSKYSMYTTYTSGSSSSISNSPSSYNCGTVTPSSTNSTGLDYFTVTNNSESAVNITISGADITGGITWTLSDNGTAGVTTAGIKAGLDGGSYNITVKKTAPFNTLKSNLGASANQTWGFQLLAPTNYTDAIQKAGTITLTATTP